MRRVLPGDNNLSELVRHRRSGFGKRSSRHPWSQPRETGQARASGPGSSAVPVPAVLDDGWPLLCGSWGPRCGHSRRSSSGHGHAVAEGPRLARMRRRTLGGLTWQKLMVSARRQSPESRGCVLLPVHCRLRTATWSSSPVLDRLPSRSICLCAHTSPFHSSTSHG